MIDEVQGADDTPLGPGYIRPHQNKKRTISKAVSEELPWGRASYITVYAPLLVPKYRRRFLRERLLWKINDVVTTRIGLGGL